MKKAIIFIVVMTACMLLIVAGAFAAGNVDKGKTLFNDAKFAGGQKSCGSCHPNGKGLEKAGSKKEFTIMGKKVTSLEDAVNMCIENANKGKAIKKDSAEMMDVVAYIKSVGAAPTAAPAAAPAPAKKAAGGY